MKMIRRHLCVVLDRYGTRVPQPIAHRFQGETIEQLGLSARPHVVEQLGPRLHASPFENLLKLSAEIRVPLAVAIDDELGLDLIDLLTRGKRLDFGAYAAISTSSWATLSM